MIFYIPAFSFCSQKKLPYQGWRIRVKCEVSFAVCVDVSVQDISSGHWNRLHMFTVIKNDFAAGFGWCILLGIEQCHFAFAGCAVPRINEKFLRTFLSGKRGPFSRTFWPWTFMTSYETTQREEFASDPKRKFNGNLLWCSLNHPHLVAVFWPRSVYHRAKGEWLLW